MDGKVDLVYIMVFEILFEIEIKDMSLYKFEKFVVEVDEKEYQCGIDQVLEGCVDYVVVECEV